MDELGNHNTPRANHRGAADRLREMLAQGHVTDQRSNAGVLEDIHGQVGGMAAAVDGMAAAIAGLADKVSALDTRLERLDERHDDQYDRLTSLEETLLVLAEALLCPQIPQGRQIPPQEADPEPGGAHRREPSEAPLRTEERRPPGGPAANGGHAFT